jgi:multiple sugar transport system ATP-binding protein
MPRELSGGQRQRVALGRALVREPKAFLFDEPLSNLDAQLRAEMRIELAELHGRLKSNFVYVTHDQIEAMTLGQRIAVIKDGKLQQVASPEKLFNAPANRFVASFLGTPSMNFLSAQVRLRGDECRLAAENFNIMLSRKYKKYLQDKNEKKILMGIRPKDLHFDRGAESAPETRMRGKFILREMLGEAVLYYFDVSSSSNPRKKVIVKESRMRDFEKNAVVEFYADPNGIHLFDPETERSLLADPPL